MTPLETDRLSLRQFTVEDAPFALALLNEPLFHRFIGDKGVRSLDEARAYLSGGPIASYARHGFGLYRVALKHDDTPIGMCGLLRRDGLADVDIGFAFLRDFHGSGYALEAATAVMDLGRERLGVNRIVAITSLDNGRSARLLEKLGLGFERTIRLPGESRDSRLFTPRSDIAP